MRKVVMNLVGLEGNAWSILGVFQSEARKQDWSQEEIDVVHEEAMNGDYNHLLRTMMKYTTTPDNDDNDIF